MDKGNEHKHAASFSLLGSSLHIGFFIVVSVLFFVLAGVWLDRKLNTVPLFIILGVLLSLAASMYEVYRIIRKVGGSGGKSASEK